MLQSFIDDSASSVGERRLVMAAFVHTADTWERIVDDWHSVMISDPPISFFHMVEAHSRRGQFNGWSEAKRTKKIFDLAEVISKYKPISIHCSLSLKRHKEVLKPHAPFGIGSPYFPLVFALTCGVARATHMLGVGLPCDFIFDRQDQVSKHALFFWDHIIGQQPQEWGQLINSSPIFGDDKDFVALQAADMLAWHVRRGLEENYPKEYDGIFDLILTQGASYEIDITNDYLDKWGQGMKLVPGSKDVVDKAAWNAAMASILKQTA
ncbi:DUF3800 domain-containing protein [Allosphingosinicella humi]